MIGASGEFAGPTAEMNTPLSMIEPLVPVRDRRRGNQTRRGDRLVADLSARFIGLPAGEVDGVIVGALRQMVETFGIDRSTLTELSPDHGNMRFTHSWAVDGVEPVAKWISTTEVVPWALARCKAGLPTVFDRLDDLPPEASVDKAFWRQIGLKSHITLPLFVGGELVGALSLGCVRQEHAWSSDELADAHRLAGVFANALARKRAHDDVERALRFERLLVDVSASLLRQPQHDQDIAMREALRSIGEFLHVERAALWSLDEATGTFELVYGWDAEGARAPMDTSSNVAFPWIAQQIAKGESVSLATVDELPAEAEVDKQTLNRLAIRSLLVVPVLVDGVLYGAFSLAAVSVAREWPKTKVPRVRLMGEILAALLARRRASEREHRARTEAAQYRDRLAHLARVHAVGAMSAAIAHEINQPLMAIENYALAAQRRIAAGAAVDLGKADALLAKIGTQATRAADVLQRLRSMLKNQETHKIEIDIGGLVRDAVNLVEMARQPQDARLEVAIAPNLPPAIGDGIQIQQVVLNLVRNATEAMDGGASARNVVKIQVGHADGADLLVSVADTGPGVAPADAERIFEPFHSTKASGLGVGLSICRAIVEAHGGRLWFAPNPDGGAVVQFTLPIASA